MTAVPARQESAVTVAVAVVVPATSVVAAEAAAGADRAAAAGVAKGVVGPSGCSWSVLRASW
jgi:hypothetical protein